MILAKEVNDLDLHRGFFQCPNIFLGPNVKKNRVPDDHVDYNVNKKPESSESGETRMIKSTPSISHMEKELKIFPDYSGHNYLCHLTYNLYIHCFKYIYIHIYSHKMYTYFNS